MASLKEVRDRIKSVSSTQQITKAMKLVSAAKLRKAQDAIINTRPYADRLNRMLSNILGNMSGNASTSFGVARPIENAVIVVVTSNRGLCGAFNTNVSKETASLIHGKYAEQYKAGKLSLLFIGKKGYDYFRRRYTDINLIDEHIKVYDNVAYENTEVVAQQLMEDFSNGKVDSIDVVYGKFRNVVTQEPTVQPWLPVPKIEVEDSDKNANADYIFEPSQQELLENLVPSILKLTFHKTLLDTAASEHGARMTAMDKATENANEMLRELKISYNKARQEAITNEILEIVGGAAALESAS